MSKKDLILEAALDLFTANGFHGTPTSKIAKEAGVANGTLFHYFASKEILIKELFFLIKGEMATAGMQGLATNASVKDCFKHLFLHAIYWGIEHPKAHKYMLQFKSSPYISLINEEEMEEQTKIFSQLIDKGINEKTLKPLEHSYIFMLTGGIITGLHNYLECNTFSKAKQHQAITQTFELVWKMLT